MTIALVVVSALEAFAAYVMFDAWRLALSQVEILHLLAVDGGWVGGLDLVNRSAGKLKRCVIYAALRDLEKAGRITSTEERGMRLYRSPQGWRL